LKATENKKMKNLWREARRFARDESGATAIEYSLIAAGIFLGIVAPIASLKTNMNATYGNILNYFG
jgi:pilus assembly protein Flp/PilA